MLINCKHVTYCVFTETTDVVAVPQGFAYYNYHYTVLQLSGFA